MFIFVNNKNVYLVILIMHNTKCETKIKLPLK